MQKYFVAIFTSIIGCVVNSYSLSISNEFTLITKFGGVIDEYKQPPANPFDCQIGFGYSAILKKYYLKIDGEILCSLSEMKRRKTIAIVDRNWDENYQEYHNIYGETDYRSTLMSVNIVPCFIFKDFYVGLGPSLQYRNVKFPQLNENSDGIFSFNTYIISGYSWKYAQGGVYIDGFIQRTGLFFKVNLLTLRKVIHSNI